MAGPIALLPLAPLADIAQEYAPAVMDRMRELIRGEPVPADLWTETALMMGLRYRPEEIHRLLQGVISSMEESTMYQEILKRGETSGERRMLLRTGTRRFGEPTVAVRARLEAITSLDALEALGDRVVEAESWDELLA